MPIKTLETQRRSVEAGRIRIGAQVPTGTAGKTRPAKLDTFRLTCRSEDIAQRIASVYGGDARPWEGAPTSGQWEVYTTATELRVVIPPGASTVSQWYELWSGGGCQRRCDGETVTLADRTTKPCICPSDPIDRAEAAGRGGACKATTRLSVMLPDLPGIGLWRVESHGWNAAVEIVGTAEALAAAGAAGQILPAVLRLEQRSTVSRGKTKTYGVPVLDLLHTLRELSAGVLQGAALEHRLPPPPGQGLTAIAAVATSRPAIAAKPAADLSRFGVLTDPVRALHAAYSDGVTRDELDAIADLAKREGWWDVAVPEAPDDPASPMSDWCVLFAGAEQRQRAA